MECGALRGKIKSLISVDQCDLIVRRENPVVSHLSRYLGTPKERIIHQRYGSGDRVTGKVREGIACPRSNRGLRGQAFRHVHQREVCDARNRAESRVDAPSPECAKTGRPNRCDSARPKRTILSTEITLWQITEAVRSEERRVGKECRSRWWRYD